MQPLHIVFIIQSLGVGGAEMSLVNLINHSDPKRFRFSIIVIDRLLTVVPLIKRSDVVVRHVPKRGKLSRHLVYDLMLVIKELRADIVHTHLFTADIWGLRAAKKAGVPVVTTEHNVNREYGLLRTLVKLWLGRGADRYVACSEAVKQYMQHTYAITRPIAVIPNGIPTAIFTKVAPMHDSEPWRLAIVGRLVEQKGHEIAFRALAQLKDIRWELKVVGDGVLKTELQQLAHELRISGRVSFAPFADDVPMILQDTDIVLVPSLWEGLGVVAREAMAAGRLVVASDTGGLKESVAHGATGWLVPSGNTFALTERLQYCFDHPEESVKLARAARDFANKHFGIATMVASYAELYQSLCASSK